MCRPCAGPASKTGGQSCGSCLPVSMEEYVVAATALWPDSTSSVNAFCKAVSVTCLELGFHLSDHRNVSCKAINFSYITKHKALLQSALREVAAPENQRMLKAVKAILPAAFFEVGPMHSLPCGVELNLSALKAAAPVSCLNSVFRCSAQQLVLAIFLCAKSEVGRRWVHRRLNWPHRPRF